MRSLVRTRALTRRLASTAGKAIRLALVAGMLLISVPASAFANIYEMPSPMGSSPTNPGIPGQYSSSWREGWGNSTLPNFKLGIPQPDPGQPAILGGFYYTTRPSNDATIYSDLWADAHMAPISSPGLWDLYVDIPSEVTNAQPGDLFNRWFEAPFSPWVPAVVPDRAYEGPFQTMIQYYAQNTTDAAFGGFRYGIDVTPPEKVDGLVAIPGFGVAAPTGWLTQSRVVLKWNDKVYDRLAGTGYFEAFIDGVPYPSSGSDSSRRVYDLKEHYPGYGTSIPTKREMTIEDLPAGSHQIQVRAVDRATNAGPLSEPVTIKVDPDIPTIGITSPRVDGEYLGAKPQLSASTTDMAGVQYVNFKVARESSPGVVIHSETDTVAPFNATVDLSAPAYADGSSYIVTASTADMAGRTNYTTKTFRIEKKPTIKVVAPSSAEVLPSLAAYQVQAEDKTSIAAVDVTIDGVPAKHFVPTGDMTSALVTGFKSLGAGVHTLVATVTNTSSGVASQTVSFSVDPTLRPVLADYTTTVDGTTAKSASTSWTNRPVLDFNAALDSVVDPTEVLYAIDRQPMTVVDPSDPNAYYASSNVAENTTLFHGTVDLLGVYLSDMMNLDGNSQLPGAVSSPLEGLWYTHALVRNASSQAGPLLHTVYGVDLTSPAAVTGVGAFTSASAVTTTSAWLDQTRIVIRWDGAQYDSLSGVDHYNVYVDGELATGDAGVSYEHGRARMALTLEDLAPGAHDVTVSAVDEAGNEGAKSAPVTVRVKSTPSIFINSPASVGTTITSPSPLRARVTDVSGIQRVEFSIDGSLVYTFYPTASERYAMNCNMFSALQTGSYTLRIDAYSVSGPSTTAIRAFNVDTSLPGEENPDPGNGGGGPVVTPSFRWYNTAFPTFTAKPSVQPTDPTELLYLVDRAPNTGIDPTNPNGYYTSFRIADTTSYLNGVIDQWGVYLSDPTTLDGALYLGSRVTQPVEGLWYLHATLRNALGEGSPEVTHVSYGVDLTRPDTVGGVGIYSSNTAVTPVGNAWLNQSRAVVRWSGAEVDQLSGTKYFKVYVDGAAIGGEERIGFQAGRPTMSLTIEDLLPGRHTVQVSAVDVAGNESDLSAPASANVDIDAPRIALTSPAADGEHVSALPHVSAEASDNAGVEDVTFTIARQSAPGVPVATTVDAEAPYEADLDLTSPAFADGSSYVVSATARDLSGRTSVQSHTVVLDKRPEAQILSPVQDSDQPQLVALKALATDDIQIASVDLRVDGNLVRHYVPTATDDKAAIVTELTRLAAGAHVFTATVTNTAGGVSIDTVTFDVDANLRPASTMPYATGALEGVANTWYEASWQNHAELDFNQELGSVTDPTEVLYLVNRTPMQGIDATNPNAYYSSSNIADNATLYSNTIDLLGVYLSNPGAFAGSLQFPGSVTSPLEGLWYTHALVRNALAEAGPITHSVYGVDMTAPTQVGGVQAFTDNVTAVPATQWLDQSRVVVRWNGGQYDALSGVAFYNVYVDGQLLGGENARVAYEHNRARMAVTLEDLAPGFHKVEVTAVDNALNEGPRSAPFTVRIKSTPTIRITAPASDDVTVTTPAPLRATIADPSGFTSVVFSIDGQPVQTFYPASAETTVMVCSAYAPLQTGSYNFTVTANSASGNTATASRPFNVDSTLPPEIDPGNGGGNGGGTPNVTPTFTWFNTEFPTFTAKPSDAPTDPTELLYLVDRSSGTVIDGSDPNSYYSSFRITDSTTYVNGLVDQRGVLRSNPVAFDGVLQLGSARIADPVEGMWYLHALFRNAQGESSPMAHVAYGVDLTRPIPVTGVQVFSSASSVTPLDTSWIDQSRVVIRWDGTERDALSGTKYYRVFIDGKPLVQEGGEEIGFQTGRATMSVTVEDLTPGAHSIYVTAVDRAGNESVPSNAASANLDFDTPTVAITAPVGDPGVVGLSSTLAATANDEVAVRYVNFRVDGTSVGTYWPTGLQTSATAKVQPDWSGFSNGTHTLTVYVADHVGHVTAESKTIVLDKTPPVMTFVSAGPTPFYPRKHDGYRDNFIVKARSNEVATAKLTIKDSTGKVWRTVTKSVPAGVTSSVYWNGHSTTGAMKAGTFRWTLQMVDACGNVSAARSGTTSIRYYQVVRTSASTVRIVQR